MTNYIPEKGQCGWSTLSQGKSDRRSILPILHLGDNTASDILVHASSQIYIGLVTG
jgi:hypothetical protein